MIRDISVEKFFLMVSLVFGFIYVFILPPFQSVDEASHFYRGYEIVNSKPLAININGLAGDYLPASLENLALKYSFLIKNVDNKINPKYIIDSSKIKLEKEKTKFINFQNTALYSPMCYLGQAPGMYIGEKLNANPLTMIYLGRISNLLFFTLIIYFSIRIIPFYKTTTMLLALMPMTLSLAGALTSDVMVIGMNFLWIALILKLLFEKEKINNLQIVSLIFLAIIIAFCKHYFMLIPLVFLIPKSRFKNLNKYIICILGVILCTLACLVFWQKIISGLSLNMNPNSNYSGQISFILTHPISYLFVLVKTLFIKTPRIIITMIGVLGWQDTRLDFLTYMLYPILIILSIITEKAEFKFEKWQLCLIFFDILATIGIIFTEVYIIWSNVGSSIIYGLNGKYFTPLMLPLSLLFYGKFKPKASENIKVLIYLAIILILISSDLSIIHRFYGLTPNLYYKV